MKRIVALISGQGSNLQALINACQQGRIKAKICAVISNRSEVYGLTRAIQHGIPTLLLKPERDERDHYDQRLAQAVANFQPDLIVLAGFMRILGPLFVQQFAGRILNIHPSLLPKYPGLHTHQRVIDNGDSEHGATVHFVTEQLDGGPIVLQAKIPLQAQESLQAVIQRVQQQEHRIYPLAVNWFIEGRLTMAEGKAWLDQQCLPAKGYMNWMMHQQRVDE